MTRRRAVTTGTIALAMAHLKVCEACRLALHGGRVVEDARPGRTSVAVKPCGKRGCACHCNRQSA